MVVCRHARLPPRRLGPYRMHMPMLKRHWTVDDLADLPDDGQRYEIIDGELFVTPSPSLRHQEAIGELYLLLRAYLSRERVGHAFFAPADVIFSPIRAVQPDLLVLPLINGRRPDQFGYVGRLLLAIEVLSPSTARADRVAKRTMFRDENRTQVSTNCTNAARGLSRSGSCRTVASNCRFASANMASYRADLESK